MITPYTVEMILKRAPKKYAATHRLNQTNPLVEGCKIGAVFAYHGEYYVYIGINARNWKMPLIAVRESDRSTRKMSVNFFQRVREAS